MMKIEDPNLEQCKSKHVWQALHSKEHFKVCLGCTFFLCWGFLQYKWSYFKILVSSIRNMFSPGFVVFFFHEVRQSYFCRIGDSTYHWERGKRETREVPSAATNREGADNCSCLETASVQLHQLKIQEADTWINCWVGNSPYTPHQTGK